MAYPSGYTRAELANLEEESSSQWIKNRGTGPSAGSGKRLSKEVDL